MRKLRIPIDPVKYSINQFLILPGSIFMSQTRQNICQILSGSIIQFQGDMLIGFKFKLSKLVFDLALRKMRWKESNLKLTAVIVYTFLKVKKFLIDIQKI